LRKKIILIGASTGGPSLIKEMLNEVEFLHSTIIIIQHMREEVIPFFIKDLEESLVVDVYATPLSTNFDKPSIIICSHSTVLQKVDDGFKLMTNTENQKYTPDINKLLHSFSNHLDEFDLSVLIMTGIGSDGINGAKVLSQKGAKIYAQDEVSSPVYGMPKAVYESGIVDEVKSFTEIKNWIKEC